MMHPSDFIVLGWCAGAATAILANRMWRRPAPPILSAPAQPGVFDAAKVREALRRGDPVEIDQAYARTFAGDMGRFVLAHWMAACGVGARQGPGLSSDDRHYFAGRHDAAVELMNLAGFDQPSAVLATLTDTLEGQTHDRSYAASPRPEQLEDL